MEECWIKTRHFQRSLAFCLATKNGPLAQQLLLPWPLETCSPLFSDNFMHHGCLGRSATCVNCLIFSNYQFLMLISTHVLTMKTLSIFRIISLLKTDLLILRSYVEIFICLFIHVGLQLFLTYFRISNCS